MCVDVSVKGKYVGVHYCVVNDNISEKIENLISSGNWEENTAYSVKAQILLESIKSIEEDTKEIEKNYNICR